MPTVTIIGAGSTVFARQIITDILNIDGLDEGQFALIDLDPTRLELAQAIAERLIALTGKRWSVRASTERQELLPGSDFIVNSIEVAGLANVRPDYDIPLKYGIDQCIGDTIGPGGIFKALRTGPVWLDILRDAERLCPDALVLNYTNPMSILTLAALKGTAMRTVGLCHSVQHTSRLLADYLELPYAELEWRCAGVNHNAWFTELRRDGTDLYPRLLERAQTPEVYERDPVRFEMTRYVGAFVTESSGHFSEYVPYFRKRPDLIERYTRPGYLGESGYYANNWPTWRQQNDARIREMLAGARDPVGAQPRIWRRHRRGCRAESPQGHLRQRVQRRADRQPARWLRGGGMPGRPQRRATLPLWRSPRAARRAQSRAHGRARVDGRRAAQPRQTGRALRLVARSAERGGRLSGRARRAVR